MQIAIDGPAGSGKSSLCRIIADKYGFIYVDTGAMYRSVTWLTEHFGKDNPEEKARDAKFIFSDNGKKIAVEYKGEVFDLTDAIRTPEISSKVSAVASSAPMRKILVEKQRKYAESGDVIMEGRDITTVVLPQADIKIFLTASPEERASRRFKEWKDKENMPAYEEVLAEIIKRDEADSSRADSPLKQAKDAVLLNTDGLTLAQAAEKIGAMITAKRGQGKNS